VAAPAPVAPAFSPTPHGMAPWHGSSLWTTRVARVSCGGATWVETAVGHGRLPPLEVRHIAGAALLSWIHTLAGLLFLSFSCTLPPPLS
jgi:hypothetical protein